MLRFASALITAALLSPMLPAQDFHGPALLALSKHDHTLAIVDPTSLKVLGKAPVGDDPHEVIASSDGRTAFVSNYGFGAFHTLARIDLTHIHTLEPIDLGPLTGPHGLTFVDDKLWFTAEGAKAIGRYDPATAKVDWILGTGQNRTHMIYVAPGGQHIVTSNVSSGTVSLINREEVHMPPPPPAMTPPPGRGSNGPHPGPPPGPRTDWNETVIKVGNGSEGFDVSPDGHEIWTANAQDGTISVIDVPSKTVRATLQADVRGANRLKFTPDGRHVLVSTLGGPNLVVLDAHTRDVIKQVPIGHGAAGILIEPGGTRAFIACTPDNYIAVIDLQTLTVTGHINVGDEPDGLAWAPSANRTRTLSRRLNPSLLVSPSPRKPAFAVAVAFAVAAAFAVAVAFLVVIPAGNLLSLCRCLPGRHSRREPTVKNRCRTQSLPNSNAQPHPSR